MRRGPTPGHRAVNLASPLTVALCLAAALVGCGTTGASTRTTPRVTSHPVTPRQDPATARRDALQATRATLGLAQTRALRQAGRADTTRRARASTHAALDRTRRRLGTPTPPTNARADNLNHRAILAAQRTLTGSLSQGTTSGGSLRGAVALPLSGPHHEVIARARPRNTQWGTPAMVRLIQESGRAVARAFPRSKLAVGNLSVRRGGDIRWSRSHNSGRDADLAFYVVDTRARRRARVAPDLISFRDDGVPRLKKYRHLRFDIPRNWALARALLTNPRGRVQYLFISEGLKRALLDHAARIGEPQWLLKRASKVLRQPTGAAPHDDHFHLRVACTRADRLRGCVDIGPRWAWLPWFDDDIHARTWTMRAVVQRRDVDAATKREAMDYLFTIGARHAADVALGVGARDPDPDVRAHALRRGGHAWRLTGTSVVLAMRHIQDRRTTATERARLYRLLRRARDPWVIPFARARLGDTTLPPRERALAASALRHHMRPELVPYLVAQLAAQPPEVQAELARVLRRITFRAEPIDWEKARRGERRAALRRWRAWWTRNQKTPREEWVRRGLGTLGVSSKRAFTYQSVDLLLKRLPDAPEHVAYNINRTLGAITGRWTPLAQTDGEKLVKYWSKWWRRVRAKRLADHRRPNT